MDSNFSGSTQVLGRVVIDIPHESKGLGNAISIPINPTAWAEVMNASVVRDLDDPEIGGCISAVLELIGDGSGVVVITLCPASEKLTLNHETERANNFSFAMPREIALKLGKTLVTFSQLDTI